MAEFGVRVEVDSSKADRLMHAILANGQKLPLRRMQTIGYRSVLRNFQEQGRPDKWPPLKAGEGTFGKRDKQGRFLAKTGANRRAGGRPLQDTGALKKSVMPLGLGRFNFVVRTRLPYAPFHQFGTKRRDGGVHIPARPFMLWQDVDIKAIEDILADHLIRGGGAS